MNPIHPSCLRALALAAALLSIPLSGHAQAFCALRDPVGIINKFEKDATGHKSVVNIVGGSVRKEVSDRLPFTLHFNELGKHTVYVILNGESPIGVVHARSEKGDWGMVEVVWYLDLDLRVKDFTFQRCRDRSRKEIESDAFSDLVRGKNFDEIRLLLNEEGTALSEEVTGVLSEKASGLAFTTIRSALKTIAVTDLVWMADVKAMGASTAPEPLDVKKHSFVSVDMIYSDDVLHTLNSLEQKEEWIVNRKNVTADRVYSEEKEFLGLLLFTECTADQMLVSVKWEVNPEGKITRVFPKDDWPSPDIKEAFQGLESFSLDQAATCSTAGQLAAVEVLAISKSILEK